MRSRDSPHYSQEREITLYDGELIMKIYRIREILE